MRHRSQKLFLQRSMSLTVGDLAKSNGVEDFLFSNPRRCCKLSEDFEDLKQSKTVQSKEPKYIWNLSPGDSTVNSCECCECLEPLQARFLFQWYHWWCALGGWEDLHVELAFWANFRKPQSLPIQRLWRWLNQPGSKKHWCSLIWRSPPLILLIHGRNPKQPQLGWC